MSVVSFFAGMIAGAVVGVIMLVLINDGPDPDQDDKNDREGQ